MSYTADWFNGAGKANFTKYLMPLKGKSYLQFLEIGCFEGRATAWMLENILTEKGCTITVIDTFAGSDEHHTPERAKELQLDTLYDRFMQNVEPWHDRVKAIPGYSQQVLKTLPGIYDFIYIDGSHYAKDVLEDAVLSWHNLKPGGIMIFDDYEWKISEHPQDNPRLGIEAFLSVFADELTELEINYQCIVQKKITSHDNQTEDYITKANDRILEYMEKQGE